GIVLLICVLYLHKYFFGLIDIPLDLRNVGMYPWKYHVVDKKVESHTLWKSDFISGNSYVFSINPTESNSTVLDLVLDEDEVGEISSINNTNNYISFDFKVAGEKLVPYGLGLTLINKKTNDVVSPKVSIAPIGSAVGLDSWYKAQFLLNDLLAKSHSFDLLKNYAVKITAQNKSDTDIAVLHIKDLKLESHDFSKVPKIKNHYLLDIIQMFPPIREYFSSSLKKGELPFWNNYILTGAEFLAEPQIGFFHPLYFLSYLLFDQFIAHAIVSIVCLLLCGIGAYLLCVYWGLGFIPSLLAGIVYMFHPFNVTHFSYEHILLCSSSLPFLILCFEHCINSKKFLNIYLLLSSFLLGLIFISGHLQVVYYTVLLFFLFVIFRSMLNYKNLFSAVFIFVIGLMIASIVILPFMSLFQNSHRVANPEGFIKASSVPISALLGLFT
ncbi:MAG: hypothetical protein HYZ79_00785, partial [Candidatus Melainabacteria bacterium]|nr:hypothetical protein [Candidatus Melainabacteria bacterium]